MLGGAKYKTLDQTVIDGKSIYVSMPQTAIQELLGNPDSVKKDLNAHISPMSMQTQYTTHYIWTYGKHRFFIQNGVLDLIVLYND